MPEILEVSYSQIKEQRTCEQRLVYRYVDKLRPKERFAPMALGSVMHDYWERYYKGLQKGGEAVCSDPLIVDDLHAKSLKATRRKYNTDLEVMAGLAGDAGNQEAAEQLLAVVPTATALLIAYHRQLGADDALSHTPVLVEKKFSFPLGDGLVMTGRIDMVTRDDRGYWLWENKTSGSIPPEHTRFRDLQTAIYVPAFCSMLGIDQSEVAGILWNQVHTARPSMPNILKNGAMSVAQAVTTEELVYQQLKKAKFDPDDYEEFLGAVRRRERQIMFPRYELPLTQNTDLLIRDATNSARRIRRLRSGKGSPPIRNIDRHCDWCPFEKLCHAALTGGDESVVRLKHFTLKEKKPASN